MVLVEGTPARSASPIMRSRNSATSYTWTCPRGVRVELGKSLGSVESVKAVSDIYAPLSGEVTEINTLLAEAPRNSTRIRTAPPGW